MNHVLLSVMARVLGPFIMLFALYVQFHGDFGPGGGFQAGVIFAAGIILYGLVYGVKVIEQAMPLVWLRFLACLGVLIYGGVGVLSMFLGANFLDYNVFASDPAHGQHYGILAIEFGVGLTVFSVMVIIFYSFTKRGELDD
jgi:multicomponent Na+:H+ antiporter subunit B